MSKIENSIDISAFIKEDPIFSFLDDSEVSTIVPYFESSLHPIKDILFKEGDPSDFIGFVINGKLEVKKQTEFKGNQLILALLTKGALVGELSLFDDQKRSATVEAVKETELLVLRHDSLDSLIHDHPEIGAKMLKGIVRVLSLRLRKATERLTAIF